ncbi:MAG: vWA domain-containing protein [Pirellulales bacterium]
MNKKPAKFHNTELEYIPPALPGQKNRAMVRSVQAASQFAHSAMNLSKEFFQGTGSFICSTAIHTILILLLVLSSFEAVDKTLPNQLVLQDTIEEEREEEFEILLDDLEHMADSMTITNLTTTEKGLEGQTDASISPPVLQTELLEDLNAPQVSLDQFVFFNKQTDSLLDDVPIGSTGSVQSIVGDYNEAMDQITQELIWMLSKDKVLVVWLFDQSESMRDDQEKIRNRIKRIYDELGLGGFAKEDALTTGVASYGGQFDLHTRAPTSDREMIEKAIDAVPVDPSGQEQMCSAVTEAIKRHRKYASIADRKVALILVTDESGNMQDNRDSLENAIAIAKATDCRVYVLGREAVFGYPFAHVQWVHPIEGTTHLLPVDRGPETAIVEQLQTDGFGSRKDALASGFGPFEQVRLAKETGGIFFMMPGQESSINEVTDRKYTAEQLMPYRPALNARLEQMDSISDDPLKQLVTKVIYDLNPYNEAVADVIEIRQFFNRDPALFVREVRQEQAKMITYIEYLDGAIEAVEKARILRDDSVSVRWQANYDLLYGQLLAYRARAYEYGAYLTNFIKSRPPLPTPSAPYFEFTGWGLETQAALSAAEKTEGDIKLSKQVLTQVVNEHSGTPWATRASTEIKRGFGVKLEPRFFDTRRRQTPPRPAAGAPARPPVRIPKL